MPSISTKRKRSESDNFSELPLPLPLTTRPLGPRTDSPVSSVPSRSSGASRAKKRKRVSLHPTDARVSGDSPQSVSTPSNVEEEAIDLTVPPREGPEGVVEGADIPPIIVSKSKLKDNPISIPVVKEVEETESAVAGPSKPSPTARKSSPLPPPRPSTPPISNMLAIHTCPICFSTVTNACLTPCGHVLCGACLWASVKSSTQRALNMGHGTQESGAKCPVCRATIKGWDGEGGGIIPLKIRIITTL